MHRIDHATAAASLPEPYAAGEPGFFSHALPGSGVTPTVVTADWLNSIQEEILGVLAYAEIAPDKTDNTQLLTALLAMLTAGGLTKATVAQILAGSDDSHYITALGLKSAMAAQTLTDAATIAWDMNSGFRAKVTLGGNRILGQPTNLQEGATGSLQVNQDGTGGRLLTYASCWDFMADGAPTLSTGAGAKDKIYYEVVDAVTPVIEASFRASA
ncbi:hypothetical protein [Phenylobacterium sp.]|uniref:hypothetical protein n=1 Tax=Phenylobacterium sp. TaxID=1871053 RepID=UPI0035B344F9